MYVCRQNLFISKVRTNCGKQTIAYTATILWENIPTDLKDLNTFNFLKHLKLYLLSEQLDILKISNISTCSIFFQFYIHISFS